MNPFFCHFRHWRKETRLLRKWSYFNLFLLLGLALGKPALYAQGPCNDAYCIPFPFTVSQNTSDWYVTISWNDTIPASSCSGCAGGSQEYIEASLDSYQNTPRLFSHEYTNSRFSGSFKKPLGPANVSLLYLNLFTTSSSCGNYYSSGNCNFRPNIGNPGSPPGILDFFVARTTQLYDPVQVSASMTSAEGSEFDQVTLRWQKGTDAPDSVIAYHIYRDNIFIAEVAATEYEYIDKNLLPGASYPYYIQTIISDTALVAGLSPNYSPNFWFPFHSPGALITGKTLTPLLQASDGLSSAHVKLSWDNLARVCSDLRIERSLPAGGFEELTILNKNATAYTDSDPIPGYAYTYRVLPLDANGDVLYTMSDQGYRKPNGIVKGKVTALGGAGVQGVEVCVVALNPVLPAGALPVPATGYCSTTNASGDYEIRGIYYHDSASFVVTPSFPNHIFGPANKQIILETSNATQAGINFTDSTSVSIFGKVLFPPAADFGAAGSQPIGIKDAKILLDTLDRGIRTNANGEWSYAVTQAGTYRFQAIFNDHDFDVVGAFADASGDIALVQVTDQNISGVDFINQEVDSIRIRVQDGCGQPLAVQANAHGSTPRVRVIHEKGPAFFDKYVSVNPTGFATVVLPASQFQLKAQDDPAFLNANVADQLTDTTLRFDLVSRDSVLLFTTDTTLRITPGRSTTIGDSTIIIPADTAFVIRKDSSYQSLQPQANFIYYGPFEVKIDFEEAGAEIIKSCKATGPGTAADSIILMKSNAVYLLDIEVVDQSSGCLVDTGHVRIYDYLGDREREDIVIPIQNGHAFYQEVAGEPSIAAGGAYPFQKLLFMSIGAGVRAPQDEGWWVLVEGAKELTPSFTTRSPEIPDLIVHDPPGDNSFAWVEKGSEYSTFTTVDYEFGGGTNVFADLIIGSKFKATAGTPFFQTGSETGIGASLVFEAGFGFTGTNKGGFRTTYAFEENFSTSSDPVFTGYEGDIYIGKALNQLFSIAKVLEFDPNTCIAEVKDKANMEPTGIASTFIYSEKHITGVIIPQIEYLAGLLREQANRETNQTVKDNLLNEADSFLVDKENWGRILSQNATNRDQAALFQKNLSFSAGASYQKTESYNQNASHSYELLSYAESSFAIGLAWVSSGFGFWSEGKAGVAGNMRYASTKETGTDSTNTFTVGYELADEDIGDFFSVDILTDPAYNVPAFRLFAGTSSCPHEPGTQSRDRAKLNVFPPRIDGVPKGAKAVFTAQLVNESESQEAREYQLRVIPQTNPGGAIVTMGGQNISNNSISYFIDAFQSTEVDITVAPGPRSANYEKIGIMMYPPCEYDLWGNGGNLTNGDTFYITVNFETECSAVSLLNPTDNWLVNANNSDLLKVDFSGYDLNNPFLESLTLEYQPQNQGWLEGPQIPRDSLKDLIYRKFWDVSGLADGQYKIRARANCNAGRGSTQSSALSGLIDRNSIAPFGIPTPSDGFLRLGQLISVTFDKDIDCGFTDPVPTYSPQITLMRTDDNTFIPMNVQCSENADQINLVPTINLFNMPELEDVILIARVQGIQDAQGNVQKYPVEWAFKVNASPVFWDPDSLALVFPAGKAASFSGTLKNTSGLSKAFEITDFPSWLQPEVLSGSILSDGEYEIRFFVDADLPIGTYRDSITAMVDGWPEYLDITYEAVATPPNWKVDPGKYTYSMNMVLALSLDQGDVNLSRDDRDMIAALFNGEIRGVAQLQYVAQFDKYMAFLTVYSDIPANEEISFSMWRASTGVEHVAKETFYFASELVYGQINNPEILHTDGVFQVIPLQQGWNWISLNLSNADMTIANLLNSLGSPEVGNNVTVKRKDGATATFTQIATPILYGSQWSGNLQQLDNKQAYLIHLSHAPDTLRVPGKPITAFDNINMLSGWNWIGFQPQSAQPVGDALSSVNLRNLDILKGHNAFSQYHKGSNTWYGGLQFMEPGKGYKLKLKDGVSYNDLVYSRLGLKDFAVDPTEYESSMTLIASVGVEERAESREERLLVGAFIDDTCRGYGFVEYVEFLEEYRVIFSLQGNASDIGRQLTFNVYDTQSGQEFISDKKEEFYVTDRILGEMMEPFVLFEHLALPEAGYFLEQNYPNPYDSKTSIRFILPQDEQVRLSVYDQLGKLIAVPVDEYRAAGEHSVVFDAAKLPVGIYHYTIEAGEFRASRKMVKM